MKPKILPEKIKLAGLIRREWIHKDVDSHPRGYYWRGLFVSPSGQLKIRIYFQRYARRIERVDYVDIHWMNEGLEWKALKPKEIRTLLKSFSENNYR
jgi:hypothetical protein